jgi:hypothetical protein
MIDRGDGDMMIVSRLLQDEKEDWHKQLDSLIWHYNNVVNKSVGLYVVNANKDQDHVMELVLYYMNQYKGD